MTPATRENYRYGFSYNGLFLFLVLTFDLFYIYSRYTYLCLEKKRITGQLPLQINIKGIERVHSSNRRLGFSISVDIRRIKILKLII